jgi:hypothetical protein
MKPYSIIITTLVLAGGLMFQSCRKGSMWGIKGEGNNMTETRFLSGFSALDLSIDANISYTQDSVYRLEITGQKNILSVMETKVEGDELVIDFKRNVWSYNTVNIVVHSPNMDRMTLSGSGNIHVENTLSGNSLELHISGSGDISVPTVSLQSLTAKISGSGNIRINQGSCISETMRVSGAGSINTEFVTAETGDVKISGSGNVTINASKALYVDISGSGDVKYRGQPKISTNISGSGELISLD